MIAIDGALQRMMTRFRAGANNPELRAIVVLLLLAATIGSIFYHLVEGWGWVDSFYFAVMALTTVGDANLAPGSTAGKLFTMVFSVIGIGLMLTFLSSVAAVEAAPHCCPHCGTPRAGSTSE